jgi:hypothetical protein
VADVIRLDQWRRFGGHDGSDELPRWVWLHVSERQALGTGTDDAMPPHALWRILLAHSGLRPTPRLVGHTLAAFGGTRDAQRGRCWPKVATIMARSGIRSDKTVRVALKQLADAGWLVIEDRRSQGWPSDYVFALPDVAECPCGCPHRSELPEAPVTTTGGSGGDYRGAPVAATEHNLSSASGSDNGSKSTPSGASADAASACDDDNAHDSSEGLEQPATPSNVEDAMRRRDATGEPLSLRELVMQRPEVSPHPEASGEYVWLRLPDGSVEPRTFDEAASHLGIRDPDPDDRPTTGVAA